MAPSAAIDTTGVVEIYPETDTSTFELPDRLTVQSVAKRRAASGKLIAGVAAPADLEAFKVPDLIRWLISNSPADYFLQGRTNHLHKPSAKRCDRE